MMGAPGYDDAPAIAIAKGDEPRPVTIIWPYYENPKFLAHQLGRLAALPMALRSNLALIVADDGSPEWPAAHVMQKARIRSSIIDARLFRLDVDIRWNWLGACNVAFHHAAGWCAKTDIDHVPEAAVLEALIWGQFDPKVLHTFERREHGTGAVLHSHPNSFFVHRDTFWRIGGYDEALSGYYGTDGDWRRRAASVAPIRRLPLALIRHEYVMDSSTTRYLRKQPEDAAKKALVRKRGKGWKPRTLSFPYHEVYLGGAKAGPSKW